MEHQGSIAGARTNQSGSSGGADSGGGIPLRSSVGGTQATSTMTRRGRKKKRGCIEGVKETVNTLLGRPASASGTAGEGGERIIHINNPDLNDEQRFLHNRIFTAKYTIVTFLPRFLYEEFSKYANLFFLFISGIQVMSWYKIISLMILILAFIVANSRYFTHITLDYIGTLMYCLVHYCYQGDHGRLCKLIGQGDKERKSLRHDDLRVYIDRTLSSMQENAKYWWGASLLSNHGETSKLAMFCV